MTEKGKTYVYAVVDAKGTVLAVELSRQDAKESARCFTPPPKVRRGKLWLFDK